MKHMILKNLSGSKLGLGKEYLLLISTHLQVFNLMSLDYNLKLPSIL